MMRKKANKHHQVRELLLWANVWGWLIVAGGKQWKHHTETWRIQRQHECPFTRERTKLISMKHQNTKRSTKRKSKETNQKTWKSIARIHTMGRHNTKKVYKENLKKLNRAWQSLSSSIQIEDDELIWSIPVRVQWLLPWDEWFRKIKALQRFRLFSSL